MVFELLGARSERGLYSATGLPGTWFSQLIGAPLINICWHQTALPHWCRRRDLDVLFLPAANRRVAFKLPCPSVGTVHDLSSLHVPGKYDRWRDFYIKRLLPPLIRRLTRVISPSESTKRDIIEYAEVPEDRVHVIPNGVDHELYRQQNRATARERVYTAFGIGVPYILYVSRLEHPGKNHIRLIDAFARMKARTGLPHRLVLVGSDWSRANEIHDAARRSDVSCDIVFLGFVPVAQLPDLYNAAELFVFPSLYEGFGMPILESMACGTPVACSNVSSMPEVGGDAAHYFNPMDRDDMARTMQTLLTDRHLHALAAEHGLVHSQRFHWQISASKTLEVLQRAAREA